jgi:uroporphyrinogen-III decarboxylase
MGMRGAFAKAPFDTLGDTMRGTQGIMMDMYRQPDKLLEAMDVIAKLTIKSVVASANASEDMIASFPLHKGADGWMSQKQFETFYWPSLKKVIDALIAEGIMVSLFAEGCYDSRLDSVNEFPKGMVHWLFDQTDMARAKAILGERCSISGNVPASLLVAGTPAEVKDYCRQLIETCGVGGGYMLAAGNNDVPSARLENIIAMDEAVKEYGFYRK